MSRVVLPPTFSRGDDPKSRLKSVIARPLPLVSSASPFASTELLHHRSRILLLLPLPDLMEPVEDTAVEAAILWLAQTILSGLLLDKLDAWLRQVGLADDTERLKSEVERVEAVVDAAKGRTNGSRPLARLLARLKELLYDADDVVDELDYYRLQHQVEGVTWHHPGGTDGEGAEQVNGSRDTDDIPSSSMGQKRSKYWGFFNQVEFDNGKAVKAQCKYCDKVLSCPSEKGTSVLSNHLKSDSCKRKQAASDQPPNLSRAGDGELNAATVATGNSAPRKRMRANEAPTHSAATSTHPWSKAEFRDKIQQMALQLKQATSEILKLYGSSSVVCSNPDRITMTADPQRRTSSLVQRKMYGRIAEKKSIMKLMKKHKFVGVTIVPIVGIGGIGKTALAQNIYNDPDVKRQFEHRIWVWVSNSFDEVRLTREMLDYVSQQKHEGITSFAKLQEILMSQITSKRFLLILDDVWDNMDVHTWNELLSPLKFNNTEGNVILVTTRQFSTAKRIGTVEPIKLDALQEDDFLLLFRACAFGDDKYEGHSSLNIIADLIAKKLHGNPLAAETAGVLLREHLTTDHWTKILGNEKWKSLQPSRGIMNSLKLSYDKLPYHIQQCFLYCSIFPTNHRFLSVELVRIWISLGFVKCIHSSERLEEIGRDYLIDLTDLGFFEQVETEESSPVDQTCYIMCAIMHDFARLLSRTECATIDASKFNTVPPTIRHLSILTASAYKEDLHGSIPRNLKFEQKVQHVVTTATKLRTLVLIGKYDSFFYQTFIDIIQKAQYLRVLEIIATYADSNYLCHSVKSTHIRYLRLFGEKGSSEALPIPLRKLYHLQVLDARHATVTINGLINMRHLAVQKGAHFMDQNSIFFDMTQLQSMNELVELGMYQLQNVNGAEASQANLRNKQHLEKMHMSWTDTLSQDGSLPMNNSNSNPISEHSAETARDVLEGLEPYHNLKHLQISGYSGATSPSWLGTSLICLQTLHLEDCGEWEKLPYLGSLSSLTKLKLRNMQKVIEVWIPSLEELVLIEMPKLERCSCNSVTDLNSSLRILKIMRCRALKAFSLFESRRKLKTEQDSWLSHLRELTIHDCPHLTVPKPLPPSSSVCKLSIARVPTFPAMKGSSSGELTIGNWESSYGLIKLDGNFLSFHNLRALTSLDIQNWRDLSSISFEGFKQLISLKRLEIRFCEQLFSSVVPLEQIYEDTADANCNALPSLRYLRIVSCGIAGNWLSVMLRHAPALQELHLQRCLQISGLLVEGTENSLSNLTSAPPRNPDDALTSSTPDGLLCIPSNLIPSIKNISIVNCTLEMSKQGFSGFTSLEKLTIQKCPKLIPSLVHQDDNNGQGNGRWLLPHSLAKLKISHCPETLQLRFQENHNCLKKLQVSDSESLKCLQLHSCTALEELRIDDCESLPELEGISTCLKNLNLKKNKNLKSVQLSSCTALEELRIEHCKSLPELEVNSTWLKELEVTYNRSLKSLQLHCCTALEELEIRRCGSLAALEGLQYLSGLRHFVVFECPGLRSCLERLPSRWGYELFPRLERLAIDDYSFLTTSFCTHLTSLQELELWRCDEMGIPTDEQKTALRFLKSLKELRFWLCEHLAYLRMDLHSLPSLKRLEIGHCPHISRLPETSLPPSLEEVEIWRCSEALTEQCKTLPTDGLKVKIDGSDYRVAC